MKRTLVLFSEQQHKHTGFHHLAGSTIFQPQQLDTYRVGEGDEPSSHSQCLPVEFQDNPSQKNERVSDGCVWRKSWGREKAEQLRGHLLVWGGMKKKFVKFLKCLGIVQWLDHFLSMCCVLGFMPSSSIHLLVLIQNPLVSYHETDFIGWAISMPWGGGSVIPFLWCCQSSPEWHSCLSSPFCCRSRISPHELWNGSNCFRAIAMSQDKDCTYGLERKLYPKVHTLWRDCRSLWLGTKSCTQTTDLSGGRVTLAGSWTIKILFAGPGF